MGPTVRTRLPPLVIAQDLSNTLFVRSVTTLTNEGQACQSLFGSTLVPWGNATSTLWGWKRQVGAAEAGGTGGGEVREIGLKWEARTTSVQGVVGRWAPALPTPPFARGMWEPPAIAGDPPVDIIAGAPDSPWTALPLPLPSALPGPAI